MCVSLHSWTDSCTSTLGVIETDFPDIWSKAVIHSSVAGSMLSIPRERNMTRLYIELHPGTTQPIAAEVANQDFVMRRAAEILHPYHIKWKSIGRHPLLLIVPLLC
jgi:phenol 2-monooxygenase (NADPH)